MAENKWSKDGAQRNDIKNLLGKTKEFAELYLTVLKERRDQYQEELDREKEKEANV